MKGLKAYKSPDGRIRTEQYMRTGERFCIVEAAKRGTLLTEFSGTGEVTDQRYVKDADPISELSGYLSGYAIDLASVDRYEGVKINAKCSKCASLGLARELDRSIPIGFNDVPVIPIFVCINSKCGQRHFSLTRDYLAVLVNGNRQLFESDELRELDENPQAAMDTLQEYIIRIFASKKISRIRL